MSDQIIYLADRLGAKVPHSSADADDERFLIDEGLDLLANYRSITDRAARLRLKDMVTAVANRPRATALQHSPEIVLLPAPRKSMPNSVRGSIARRVRGAAVFAGLLVLASFALEVLDPAPANVIASAYCRPLPATDAVRR